MRIVRSLAFAAGILSVTIAPESGAQNPHRQGLWFETGGGAAAIRIGCSQCAGVTRASGSGGYFRIGGTISPKVLLGIESYGFINDAFSFAEGDSGIVVNNANVNVVTLWYPWRTHFFLKGGVGIAQGDFSVFPTPTDTVVAEGVGVGLTFGVGLDVPISRIFAVTGNAAAFMGGIGDIKLPGTFVDDVIPTTYLLSIGVTVR